MGHRGEVFPKTIQVLVGRGLHRSIQKCHIAMANMSRLYLKPSREQSSGEGGMDEARLANTDPIWDWVEGTSGSLQCSLCFTFT